MTLQDLNLPEPDRRALLEAAALLKDRYPVCAVVLFGSKARDRGEAGPDSDLDLLVLTTRPVEWAERKAMLNELYDIQLRYDVLLSPLIVLESDWGDGPYSVLPLYDEISEQGVAV